MVNPPFEDWTELPNDDDADGYPSIDCNDREVSGPDDRLRLSVYERFENGFQLRRNMRRFRTLYANWTCVRSQCWALDKSTDKAAQALGLADFDRITTQLDALKQKIDSNLTSIEINLDRRLRELFVNVTVTSLSHDISCFKEDLDDFLHLPKDYQGSCRAGYSTYFTRMPPGHPEYAYTAILFRQRDLVDELIAELNRERERRQAAATLSKNSEMKKIIELTSDIHDLAAENFAAAEEIVGLKNTVTDLQETISRLKEELKQASKKNGSRYEQATQKYLAAADEKEKVLKRITNQWTERRGQAPDEHRRSVDKIYRGILDKFNEEL